MPSANAVMRGSEFDFYSQCLSRHWLRRLQLLALQAAQGGYIVIWLTVCPEDSDAIFFIMLGMALGGIHSFPDISG